MENVARTTGERRRMTMQKGETHTAAIRMDNSPLVALTRAEMLLDLEGGDGLACFVAGAGVIGSALLLDPFLVAGFFFIAQTQC